MGRHCSVSLPLTEEGRSKILRPLKAAFAYTWVSRSQVRIGSS